jgi:hypothetical protein
MHNLNQTTNCLYSSATSSSAALLVLTVGRAPITRLYQERYGFAEPRPNGAEHLSPAISRSA